MPTNAQWVNGWKNLSISGVTGLQTPPQSLNTAQLPVGWPDLPEVTQGALLVSCVGENKSRFMVYHIALEPIGQNLPSVNYDSTVTLQDNIETAVDGLKGVLMNFIDYVIRGTAEIRVADIVYWGLRVEATGTNVR